MLGRLSGLYLGKMMSRLSEKNLVKPWLDVLHEFCYCNFLSPVDRDLSCFMVEQSCNVM